MQCLTMPIGSHHDCSDAKARLRHASGRTKSNGSDIVAVR